MISKDRIDELKKEMNNVPFGNSIFQNQHFTAGQEGAARRYRHCLLQINIKLNALKECEFRRKRIEIDITEIEHKLLSVDKFEKQRLEIDLEEKQYGLNNELKLIADAIIEIETYEKILQGLPKVSRAEFEEQEAGYWKERLLGDAQRQLISDGRVAVGTMESLERIGIVGVQIKNNQLQYQQETLSGALSRRIQ